MAKVLGKDWVWVNWGAAEGKLPCHIWCFVVLKNMPTGRFAINHGGIKVKNGIYAVVEASALDRAPGEIERSDLMMPFLKEVEICAAGKVKKRTFYLADTEAFVGPCCAVPDIGGPINRYFVVKPRNEWADAFLKWVKDEHNIDKMDVFLRIYQHRSLRMRIQMKKRTQMSLKKTIRNQVKAKTAIWMKVSV